MSSINFNRLLKKAPHFQPFEWGAGPRSFILQTMLKTLCILTTDSSYVEVLIKSVILCRFYFISAPWTSWTKSKSRWCRPVTLSCFWCIDVGSRRRIMWLDSSSAKRSTFQFPKLLSYAFLHSMKCVSTLLPTLVAAWLSAMIQIDDMTRVCLYGSLLYPQV